jgi:hypothetical protein
MIGSHAIRTNGERTMSAISRYLQSMSPTYGKRKAAERQREQDRVAMQDILGNVGVPAQNLAPDAFDMEESQVMQQLNPEEPGAYFTPEQEGSGIRGGNVSREELAFQLAGLNSMPMQQAGASMIQGYLEGGGKQQDPYVKTWVGDDGVLMGLTQDGMSVEVPGARTHKNAPRSLVDINMPGAEKGGFLTKEEARKEGLSDGSWWSPGDGGPPKRVSNYTAVQMQSANYANQLVQSSAGMESMENRGYQSSLRNNVGTLGLPGTASLSAFMQSPTARKYNTYATEWLMAHLRKTSGATLTQSDLDLGRAEYFYSPGDGPEQMKQKAAARKRYTRGVIAESAGAYAEHLAPHKPKHKYDKQGVKIPGSVRLGKGASLEEIAARIAYLEDNPS